MKQNIHNKESRISEKEKQNISSVRFITAYKDLEARAMASMAGRILHRRQNL
jgi:hypothetical protein